MTLRRIVAAVVALAFVAALAPTVSARVAAPATLRVFAAASLSDAFGELGSLYERQHPGTHVQLNLAGSQQLATQLEQGAAADVFASADERWMRRAGELGLTAGAPATFASNRLVVIVPRTNPARIGRLQDLARGGVKFVIGADAVPVGHYARTLVAALAHEPGFPADFARRALANVVSEEENVKSVVGKVQLGEADAGIAYRSDVTPQVARFVTVFDPPAAASVTAVYPIAVLKAAARPGDAQAFVDLVLSPAGQRVLARWGFGAPVAATP